MMTKYSRVLSAFCPVLFLAAALQAQPKGVRINVEVLRVDSGLAGQLAETTADPGELLKALMADRNTGVISRSRLRVSDGMRAEFGLLRPALNPAGILGSRFGSSLRSIRPMR